MLMLFPPFLQPLAAIILFSVSCYLMWVESYNIYPFEIPQFWHFKLESLMSPFLPKFAPPTALPVSIDAIPFFQLFRPQPWRHSCLLSFSHTCILPGSKFFWLCLQNIAQQTDSQPLHCYPHLGPTHLYLTCLPTGKLQAGFLTSYNPHSTQHPE